jgi:hypothetical protein
VLEWIQKLSCLWGEDDEQHDGRRELAACEVSEETKIRVECPGVQDAQYVERTAHWRLHQNGEAEEATLLELCRSVSTSVAQVDPKHQDQDLACKRRHNRTACYTTFYDERADKKTVTSPKALPLRVVRANTSPSVSVTSFSKHVYCLFNGVATVLTRSLKPLICRMAWAESLNICTRCRIRHIMSFNFKTNKQTNPVAFSPQANSTDWAAANCRRILVPTFADRWVSRGQRGGSPTVVNLSFLDRSRYFSFKYLLIYAHVDEWTPFQTYCCAENLVAPGIEPGTSGFAARNSDH